MYRVNIIMSDHSMVIISVYYTSVYLFRRVHFFTAVERPSFCSCLYFYISSSHLESKCTHSVGFFNAPVVLDAAAVDLEGALVTALMFFLQYNTGLLVT